jgi:hypothetical protein
MFGLRLAMTLGGVLAFLGLAGTAKAGVYYQVDVLYADDLTEWKLRGGPYIMITGNDALNLARDDARKFRHETNVVDVRIMRTSDEPGSKPEVVWSLGGAKAGTPPELPGKSTVPALPQKGKKEIVVRVYKYENGKSVEQKEREFRTNSEYDVAKGYYEKMKTTPGYTATWNAPGWDTPAITMPDKKWVDVEGVYNNPKVENKNDLPKDDAQSPANRVWVGKRIGTYGFSNVYHGQQYVNRSFYAFKDGGAYTLLDENVHTKDFDDSKLFGYNVSETGKWKLSDGVIEVYELADREGKKRPYTEFFRLSADKLERGSMKSGVFKKSDDTSEFKFAYEPLDSNLIPDVLKRVK